MLEELKKQVCEANLALPAHGLVTLTWGNVSGRDMATGLVVIKPSGVAYEQLEPESMVVLDLNGNVREGDLRPSSDTPTHLELYRAFPEIGGITHTHSTWATAWAQAKRPLPCLGTTHADHFYGQVPCTRLLTPDEIEDDYERKTGELIVETVGRRPPLEMSAVLVAGHGPFTWGETALAAVENAIVLEEVARIAVLTAVLNPGVDPIPEALLGKHFLRKHGPGAYYGQED